MRDDRKRRIPRKILWLTVLLVSVWAGLVTFRTGPEPQVRLTPSLPGIGRETPVEAVFSEPVRGLSRVRLELVQGDLRVTVAEETFQPLAPWKFWGERTRSATLMTAVGSRTIEDLAEGEATLRAVAERPGTWLRHPEAVVASRTLPVRLRPPRLEVVSRQHYPAQGGSGVVVYRAGPSAAIDGVEVGEAFFQGRPLAGSESDRFALYAVPFDVADPNAIRLMAEDEVGNRTTASFVDRFFPRPFRTDTIRIDDEFMARVVPEILDATPEVRARGSLLDSYLAINGTLRQANARTLTELGEASVDRFLWSRPFVRMPNSQVMSTFADRRTYTYEEQVVDHQDHLGLDLASVRRDEVPAANAGRVVLARYFGIYGNAVVIDHGYGLQTLYGHLSSIAAAEGESVTRGQTIGRTGETGLAGGDHLHFTMLLRGVPVQPIEWWDPAWIEARVASKLGDALPYSR